MSPSITRMLVVLGVAILAACASAGRSGAPCSLLAADSTYQKGGAVFRDCAVQKKAVLITKDLHPTVRPDARSACFAAEAEFVVNAAGTVEMETAHLTRATDTDFGAAVMAILPQLRYRPGEIDGAPVRQIVDYKEQIQTMHISVPAGSPRPTRPPMTPAPGC